MHDLPNFIEPLLDLCRDAGELICGHYNAPGAGDYQAKVDDSPLTQADLEGANLHCINLDQSRLREANLRGADLTEAVLTGADPNAVQSAQELGAAVGARSYSKDFELEADALGTVIAHRAGYDPVRGAEFFNRIPDPGDQFLGTHPPNKARMAIVRQTAAKL